MTIGLRALIGPLCLVAVLAGPARAWAGDAAAPAPSSGKSPTDVVKDAPKGSLKNPYTGQDDKIAQGHELFMSYSCNGCHGGTGGGGMCPPINGDIWFYGIDDDTLFRLITLGTLDLQKAGYERLGGNAGSLQMPPFGALIKSDDELWKIIAWIRSIYTGDPKKKTW
jgi:mono/diheme cytochrome c family protein